MSFLSSILSLFIIPSAFAMNDITTKEAHDLIQTNATNSNFVILDVRTPDEFASGHIAKALNIDFNAPSFATEISKLAKEKDYLVYCRSGRRSAAAAKQMDSAGFSHVNNMQGGILKWTEEGRPLQK